MATGPPASGVERPGNPGPCDRHERKEPHHATYFFSDLLGF